MKNSEIEMCMWKVVNLETAILEDEKRITLRVRTSGSAFCRNIRDLREKHGKPDNLFKCDLNLFILFSFQYALYH